MLTKHQEDLYALYKEIDQICREHGIEYSIAGGTLIGAIRHRGFVPWDDDMDLYMTLKNWRKFMDLCENGNVLPKGRVLECTEFNKGFHNPIARYTDITKTAIHKNQVLHDDKAGFVIDIFALDPIPNDKKAFEQYNKDILLFSDLINGSIVYSYRFRVNKFRYFYYRAKMKLLGKEKVLSQVEGFLTKYDEDECDYYAMRWGGVPLYFPKDMIGDCSLEYDYEDTTTMSLVKPIDYLVYHYGDEWMYIPPVTEQQGHDAVFNTEIAYPAFKEEIDLTLNVKSERKRYVTRQKIAMLCMDSWNDLKDLNFKLKKSAVEMELKIKRKENDEAIKKAKQDRDYLKITELFADYIDFQNERRTIGRFDYVGAYRFNSPVLISIPTEDFELVLTALFHTGRISVAKRFIEVYEFNKGKKTPAITELDKDITLFRKAVSEFAQKNYEIAIPLIDRLLEKYPECNSMIKLKINQYLMVQGVEGNEDKIIALTKRGLELFPNDPDFPKYYLDTQYKENKEDTLVKYIDAWGNTTNGYIRLDIEDKIRENLDFCLNYCLECIGKEIEPENVLTEQDENEEEIIEGSFLPKEYVVQQETSLAIITVGKLNQIIKDNVSVQNTKLEILKRLAENETDPVKKAEAQHRVINNILRLRKIYNEKFQSNQFKEMEELVIKWYYTYYKSINNSDFITYTTAELIANEEYQQLYDILDRVEKYEESLDKDSEEYNYCQELKGRVFFAMGDSEKAYKIYCNCAKNTKDEYLKVVLRNRFIYSLSTIYSELLSSYNKSFIHKSLESSGLSPEEYYSKTINNKRRLAHFYKERILRVYPTAMKLINILKKTGALTKEEAKEIITDCKIGKTTKLSLRIITSLHKTIVGYTPDIEDDSDFLEEVSEQTEHEDSALSTEDAFWD